jgi:hypothetical protein
MYGIAQKSVKIENHPMVGQVIKKLCTGLTVDATVVEVVENEYSIIFKTVMHESVQWGDDVFTEGNCSMRKCDQWIIGTDTVTPEQFLGL